MKKNKTKREFLQVIKVNKYQKEIVRLGIVERHNFLMDVAAHADITLQFLPKPGYADNALITKEE